MDNPADIARSAGFELETVDAESFELCFDLASVLSRDEAQQIAALSVRDEGVGIDPLTLPIVFQPFTQFGGGAREHGGLGLGLALVHALALAHGGTAEAKSEGGLGTAPWLTAPNPPKSPLMARFWGFRGCGIWSKDHPRARVTRALGLGDAQQARPFFVPKIQSES